MDKLPKLEIIANFGVGYESIDTAAAKARNIRVTNTPNVLNNAVAEITIGLMIALARRIPQADQFVRQGKWPQGHLPASSRAQRQDAGHPRPRPHRQGDRRARAGDADARRLSRPPQAARRAVRLLLRSRRNGARRRLAGGHRAGRQGDRKDRVARRCWRRSAPKATSSTWPAARWSTRPRWSSCCRARSSAARRSTCSRRSRNVPEALFALDNVVLSPHQGSATHQTRDKMGATRGRQSRRAFRRRAADQPGRLTGEDCA